MVAARAATGSIERASVAASFFKAGISDIQVMGELGVLLDESVALLGLAAHQILYKSLCAHRLAAVFDAGRGGHVDLQKDAFGRVHRRFAEMNGLHLAQALEAGD